MSGTKCEFCGGSYEAAGVGCCLLGNAHRHITRLRAESESERNELANEHLREGMANLAAKVVDLESQLAALRRPVVQSEQIEVIRRRDAGFAKDLDSYTYIKSMIMALKDRRLLLSALDQAQREIQQLKDSGQKIDDELVMMTADRDRLQAKEQSILDLIAKRDDYRAEIARLSSPPEDRAAIAARIADFRASIADWGHLSETESAAAVSDIEALLQDCARYRNALKVSQETIALVTRERDIEQLEAERDEARDQNFSCAMRIERLEAALRQMIDCAVRGQSMIKHATLTRAREALAAADGQEPAPEQSLIETTRRSPRVVDAGNLRDAADGQRDLLTADQVLSTLTPEQRAATEALRQEIFGDGVVDGQQPYIVQGFWSPCRKYIASVHISNGRLVAVQDDNGDAWEPTGPAQDMAKVTP